MKFAKICLAAVAAASLISAPLMAETLSPSARAAVKVNGAGTKSEGERKKRPAGWIFGAIAAAGIGAAVALSSSGSNKRASP